MPIIATPDLSVHYREAGAGEQALVFVHGNYGSSRWWVPQLERIPACMHAYAPDLLGCGSAEGRTTSTRRRPHLTIRDLADDLYAFVHALGLEKPVFVGHSIGAVVVTEYAIAHPDDLRGMVLVDTIPAAGLPMAAFAAPFSVPLAIAGRSFMRVALRHAGLPRSGALPEALIDDALNTDPRHYAAFTQALVRWNVEPDLPKLGVPTLLVWGEQDRLMSPRIAKGYLELLPQARLVVMPGTGHSPIIERPDRFVALLRAFVTPLMPAAPRPVRSRRPSRREHLLARLFRVTRSKPA